MAIERGPNGGIIVTHDTGHGYNEDDYNDDSTDTTTVTSDDSGGYDYNVGSGGSDITETSPDVITDGETRSDPGGPGGDSSDGYDYNIGSGGGGMGQGAPEVDPVEDDSGSSSPYPGTETGAPSTRFGDVEGTDPLGDDLEDEGGGQSYNPYDGENDVGGGGLTGDEDTNIADPDGDGSWNIGGTEVGISDDWTTTDDALGEDTTLGEAAGDVAGGVADTIGNTADEVGESRDWGGIGAIARNIEYVVYAVVALAVTYVVGQLVNINAGGAGA